MKTNKQIEDFLYNLSTDIDILEWVDIKRINENFPFESIYDMIDENRGFELHVNDEEAIQYLDKHDPFRVESMAIALSYGYVAKDMTPKLLARLLYSVKTRRQFLSLKDKIESFFKSKE